MTFSTIKNTLVRTAVAIVAALAANTASASSASAQWNDEANYKKFRCGMVCSSDVTGDALEKAAEEIAEEGVSTPEPSFIVSFITLGGLMLGSKGKTKD